MTNLPDFRQYLGLVSVLVALQAAPAAAAQTTFFGIDDSKADLTNSMQARDDFLATLGVWGTDTLESVAGMADPPLAFGATGITATTDFDSAISYVLLSVSGSVLLLDDGPDGAEGPAFDDVIELSEPVTAFGSFFAQGGDGPANTLTLRLENTGLATSKDVVVGTLGPTAPFNNIFFFGVTDTDPFDRITMIESYDYDGILLDDITVGFLVPEPSGLGLLACGAALALLCRRRRRR